MAKLFYSILLVSIFGMVLGFEIDKNEPDCEVRRYYGQKFIFGTKTRTETDVESADICAWICYQYNAQGEKCASANYWDDFKECQMNSDTHLDVYDGVGNLYSRPGWVYVVPKSCNGKPMPETTEAPAPTPAPTQAPYPGNTGGSTGGSTGSVTDAVTNNIQPGSCGQSNVQNKVARGFLSRNSHHRIVGGLIANPHSMPWIVSLRLRLVDFHFCGGTLVRVSDKVEESDIIITAAHCMEGSSPNFDVVAGAHYQKTKQPGEQAVRAERFVIHHGYNIPLRSENNDIAIVKLSKPIKFSSTVQPACLPAQNETIGDGVNGIVAGWGNSREGGSSPDALNQVVVPTMSSEQCRRNPKYKDVIAQTMLCAGYDAGQKDACQGDSGGPFVFLGKNGYTLHGVVSWGIGCARAGNPGIYARVSNYADWIQQQIQRLTSIRV